jgi:hypothetical protein
MVECFLFICSSSKIVFNKKKENKREKLTVLPLPEAKGSMAVLFGVR